MNGWMQVNVKEPITKHQHIQQDKELNVINTQNISTQ